ncbi:uncharacterized protein LOC118178754 [Oxyura jamaicensis]|uniref:uncharacterized protein LOC118178754 n=1 Tax=Oxyura jamaicensis TaxID=8884 RepID=UPI0015A53E9E|nr:uncharacterized protein LOC118178754 [Oxyura jamaicensis]
MPSSGWNERRGFLEGSQSLVLANSASAWVCFHPGQQAHELPHVLSRHGPLPRGAGGAKGTGGIWAREASCHRQLRRKKMMLFSVLICLSGWVWVAMAPEARSQAGRRPRRELPLCSLLSSSTDRPLLLGNAVSVFPGIKELKPPHWPSLLTHLEIFCFNPVGLEGRRITVFLSTTETGYHTFSARGMKTKHNDTSDLISVPALGGKFGKAVPREFPVFACSLLLRLSKMPRSSHRPCMLGKSTLLRGRKAAQGEHGPKRSPSSRVAQLSAPRPPPASRFRCSRRLPLPRRRPGGGSAPGRGARHLPPRHARSLPGLALPGLRKQMENGRTGGRRPFAGRKSAPAPPCSECDNRLHGGE